MTETETQTVQKTPGRKPGQPTRDADVVAIENAQKSISRLLWFLSANPSDTLGIRLARCAKAGVPRARAEKGLVMVEEAVLMARTQFEAAYSAPVRDERKPAERPTVSL